jgi:hypothetical protein
MGEWATLNQLGTTWETSLLHGPEDEMPDESEWKKDLQALLSCMPSLDLWFHVVEGGYPHVSSLLPSLKFTNGLVGVRLRLEPAKDAQGLQQLAEAYVAARKVVNGHGGEAAKRAWPVHLHDFFLRQPKLLGSVVAYKLDPEARIDSTNGVPNFQKLMQEPLPVDRSVVERLIRIDFIGAQRGFGVEDDLPPISGKGGLFSRQLVRMARERLDSVEGLNKPQQALQIALAHAQAELDTKVGDALKESTKRVQKLGYPGFHDPQELGFRSRIQPAHLLDHDTAVVYGITPGSDITEGLPEHAIGLGYQNLQSISYTLDDYRQRRLTPTDDEPIKPIHLVLLEEPEAHLHVQAQRGFVSAAYKLLVDEKTETFRLASQLVISTHSSHLAHANPLTKLRYVRRVPATPEMPVPSSTILTLADVFGTDHATRAFAERYLRVQHADLLFADAAVFVEGMAERLLLPFFVEQASAKLMNKGADPGNSHTFGRLGSSFLSYLEVGGSHAHKLEPLVKRLGIPTLVITDLDPGTGRLEQGQGSAYTSGDHNDEPRAAPLVLRRRRVSGASGGT